MGFRFLLLFASLFSFLLSSSGEEISLNLGPFRGLEVNRPGDGVSDLKIEGGDPHFWSGLLPESFDPAKHTILGFEYFSPDGVKSFSLRFRQPDGTVQIVDSIEVPLAETWVPLFFDLTKAQPALERVGEKEQRFHFSFQDRKGTAIGLRKMVLREPIEEERQSRFNREALLKSKQEDAARIADYFDTSFPGRIDRVVLRPEKVLIVGTTPQDAVLRELRPVHASHIIIPDPPVAKNISGDFEIELPRFVEPGNRDRALSRFRLESGDGEFLSRAVWVTKLADGVSKKLGRIANTSQKGLGGIPEIADPDHEIFELGLSHATINVVLNALISDRPRPNFEKVLFEGKPFYLNRGFLQRRQRTVQLLRKNGITVTAILLVSNQRDSPMVHPESESRGKFVMPNLREPHGTAQYLTALRVLGNHFTQPGYRISNWVVHNEFDQAGTWTNMGDQPVDRYLESYSRSARLIYSTMRARDPHSRVFISLTHHWTKKSSGAGTYTVRPMLERFAQMAKAEGDYEWGVAYHPYPRNLRDPDTWKDAGAEMNFDTPYITPRNFEVLPFFLQQERFLYEEKPRGILFSEQGFNSPTLSEEDQRRQVAGMVYMWRRLPNHPIIEAFHLHRYKDMPGQEGGLRLGIVDENGNRKLGWEAWRDLETPAQKKWEQVADEVIGSE